MYRMYECRGRMDAQERPQRSGRVTGFKRFPVDQAASDHRFPVFARPPSRPCHPQSRRSSGTRGEDFDMSTARLAAVKPDVAREIPMQPASPDIWEKKYRLTSKSGEAIAVTIDDRSEEHTSELPSLMRNSYAV